MKYDVELNDLTLESGINHIYVDDKLSPNINLKYKNLNYEDITVSDSNIYINDALGGLPLELSIDGKSSQETRSGKNLFDYGDSQSGTKNGITYSYDKSTGIWTLNGTATEKTDIGYLNAKTMVLQANTNYRVTSFYVSGTISNGSVISFAQDKDNSWYGIAPTLTSANNYSGNAKPTTTLTLQSSKIIRVANGTTLSNFKFKTQVELGTTTTEYELFGVQPSPDYPSEIDSIGNENLFDKDNSIKENYNLGGDGSITYNSGLFVQEAYISVQPNTQYTITTSVGNYKRIGQYTKDKVWISRLLSGASDTKYTFKTASNCYYLRIGCSIVDLDNLQLEKGTQTKYRPYGTLPIEIVGKNLFDKDNAKIVNVYMDSASGKLVSDGNHPSCFYIKCKENTTYTISRELKSRYFYVAYTTELPQANVNFYGRVNNYTGSSITITTGENARYLVVRYYYVDDGYTKEELLDKMQVEKGTQATDYEEYRSKRIYIPIGSKKFCSVGSIKDTLNINMTTGVVSKISNIGEVVLNGSESWSLLNGSLQSTNIMPTDIQTIDSNTNAMSNYFKYKYYASGITSNIQNGEIGWNSGKKLTIKIDSLTTKADYTTWLSSNNTTVQYVLATPKEEFITSLVEVFKYIADSSNYIKEISFGAGITCNNNQCISYRGTSPTGYENISDWFTKEIEKGALNAWKIVNDTLTYDSAKYTELMPAAATQAEENSNATHKWVKERITPVNLYNSAGSNETITLSDSVTNYSRIKIFYRSDNEKYSSVEIDTPNGKYAYMQATEFQANKAWLKFCNALISGNTITPSMYSQFQLSTNPAITYNETNNIFITKVIGYK